MNDPLQKFPARYSCLLIFLLGLCLFPVKTINADDTRLPRIEIYAYGPGALLVMDIYGRRSGRDLGTGDLLEEIPRSEVIKEGTTERIPGWTILLQDPVQGVYRLKLTATGSGAFAIDVDTVDSAGNLLNSHVFRRVKPGDSLEFLLTYSSDPGGKNSLLESSTN